MKLIIILLLFITNLVLSCSKDHYVSSPKNLVILGNSIVRHGPRAEVGWFGDWGMAASTVDSDFVHRIIKTIKIKNLNYKTDFLNIATFETNFYNYNLNQLNKFKNSDVVLIKIGENIVEKTSIDSNFIAYYDKLINYLKTPTTTIVLSDGFYNINKFGQEDSTINLMIQDYAKKNNFLFIKTNDLAKDSTNRAYKTYIHPGVQAHPSDKGMRLIHDRIWEQLKSVL
jgi:hypothetical protein